MWFRQIAQLSTTMSAITETKTVSIINRESQKQEEIRVWERVQRETPSPESNGVPLLDLEALGFLGRRRRTGAGGGGIVGGNHWHVGIQSRHAFSTESCSFNLLLLYIVRYDELGFNS